MSSWQTEFTLALRRGPFAYTYWIVVSCCAAVVIGSFWASTQFRSVSSAIVFAVIIAMNVIRYWIAVTRSRRLDVADRDAERPA